MIMATATCVECDEEIEINDRPRRGLRIICPNCGVKLEVVRTVPIELDIPYDEEEWDDDDDDDFELDDDAESDFDDDDFDDFDDLEDDELDDPDADDEWK